MADGTQVLAPPSTTEAACRALVIAPQWIGDAVMSQPLLARLSARGERISVAALPWVAPVYRAMPQVAAVIELPFAHGRLDAALRWRIAAEWRGRFEVAYVLPNSIKSALLPWLAGIRRRIGYQGEGRPWLLNRRLPNPPGRPPMVAFYSALAIDGPRRAGGDAAVGPKASGVGSDSRNDRGGGDQQPRLRLPPGVLQQAAARAGVVAKCFWVLAPGAEYGPAKRWPAPHYAALARSLSAARGGPVLLLGSAGERGLCDDIARSAPGCCQVLAGRTPLLEAMALIAMARGVVSNDSGLMHVAAAFGVPQVAIFGSTSPAHTPPLNRHARVIWLQRELQQRLGLTCVPCFERDCRYGHTACLAEVAPPDVQAALQAAVAEAGERETDRVADASSAAPSSASGQGASLPT